MLDFVPLIDSVGETATIALAGLALAVAFGIFAERSGFCTRSAILEVLDGIPGTALAVWLAAFGSAILLVQAALFGNLLSVDDSRFFSGAQSLSGPILGGMLFGVGMSLARGCSSRLLVLGATGNLRAITAMLFLGLAAFSSISGFLAPAREALAGLANTSAFGGNDLGANFGSGIFGILAGATLVGLAIVIGLRAKVSAYKLVGGAGIAFVIATAWMATYSLSSQLFDPIAIEGISFVRPSASMVAGLIGASETGLMSFDGGILAGIVLGAFLAAVLSGSFKIQGFSDPGVPHILRYVVGGVLMGFGGVLAGGCAVGAGFSGGSVLAISALLALFSMILSAAVSETVLREWHGKKRVARLLRQNEPLS